MFRKITFFILLLILITILNGCAAGTNPMINVPTEDGSVAGFWFGLWHGMICPITFVAPLFSENVHFYEVHNNGGWYNFGFILGVGALGGSSSRM